MEKLTVKKKLVAVRQYLAGKSYDEVAVKCGISKGMVANIVTELKAGGFPEVADAAEQVELLRELSIELKHSGLSPGQCAIGLSVLNRINECGLNVADIGRWPDILKAADSEQSAKDFVEMVYRIQEYQKKMGLTLEEVDEKLHELETKSAELEPITKQLKELQKELAKLTSRRDELTPLVNNLTEKYNLLNPRVKELEEREEKLSQRIKDEEKKIEKTEAALIAWSQEQKKLQKTGFSLEALVEFDEKIRSIAAYHNITVSGVRDRLLHELESLDKGLGLEKLIQDKKVELHKHQQAITSAKNKHEKIKASIASLEKHMVALEAGIKATQEKVSDEIAKVVPMAKETINRFAQELQLGNKTMLDEVRNLKDQALEVGKEIGRFEEIVKTNEWLSELLSLVNGGDGLEAGRVRTILLQILCGSQSWIKRNQAKMGLFNLMYKTGQLVDELEQWQIKK